MPTLELEQELATKAGRVAARLGKALAECPYNPDGDPRNKALTIAFVRGWRSVPAEGVSTTEASDSPAVRLMARALEHLPGKHPQDSHGGDGVPDIGVLDKLKLGKRIQLGEGEALVSSRKFKTDRDDGSMDMLAAEVETPSGREVRIGIIDPDDSKRWPGGPDPKRDARAADIRAERAELDEDDPRFEQLGEELDSIESEADQGGLNRTAALTPATLGELHATLDAAAAKAREWSKAWNKFWDEHDDEASEQSQLANLDQSAALTTEQAARFAELNAILDRSPEWEPTFAEGFVSVHGGGQLAYRVQGFDGEGGRWRIDLGIRPHGGDETWYPGANDDAARFDPKDVKALLAGLGELGGTADQASRVPFRLISSPAVRLMLFARSLEGTELVKRGGHLVTIHRGAKGRFGDTVDLPDLKPERKPRGASVAKALLSGDPRALDGFNREQLRREAGKRGIALKRGAGENEIRDALWDHERTGVDDEADLPAADKAELDLARMTVPDLKARAKAEGVKGYSKMRKPELVAALKPQAEAAPVTVDAATARRAANEQSVRDAFQRLRPPGKRERVPWLGLADLRAELGHMSREEQDATLLDMVRRQPDVRMIPVANRKSLTKRDHDAALFMGEDNLHAIGIFEPESNAAVPAPPPRVLTGRQLEIELTALQDQLRFAKPGPNRDFLQQRIDELSGGQSTPAVPEPRAPKAADEIGNLERRIKELGVKIRGERSESALTRLRDKKARLEAEHAALGGKPLSKVPEGSIRPGFASRDARDARASSNMAQVTADLEALRRNPVKGDREKVAAILKDLKHGQLDQLAADNGWQVRGTLAQKREQLEQNYVGRRLTADAIFALGKPR